MTVRSYAGKSVDVSYAARHMLKGTRTGIVNRIQPISVHGQVSLDVFWTDPEDPESEIRHARVGQESVPRDMAAGDKVTMHYLLGMVTKITK